MVYPDPATKNDPQCKFLITHLSLWHIVRFLGGPSNLPSIPGANINGLSIASVEMNIGIIAASLIVMRPCLKAIRTSVVGGFGLRDGDFLSSSSSSARHGSRNTSPSLLWRSWRDGKGIVRTVDVEMESQPVSAIRQVVPKDLI